jgi:crotonobetainyl-CoA:carnitine CoA-transferase CaiB-like acyl-CoA transferase
MTREQAAAKLRAARTAYGFINGVAEFAHHPALRRVTIGTSAGDVSMPAPPVITTDGPPAFGPVPAVGAHSAAIRAEFAA